MERRTLRRLLPSFRDDIGNLHTVRPLPSPLVDGMDPFLLLNHHGPQTYPKNNRGLPFGPHPHRGFQTVTFVLEGDISHRDSAGNESIIGAGGVQWMSAGRGLVHEELSSDDFKKRGGPLEILQLWVNLPRSRKMSDPFYEGHESGEIPVVEGLGDGVTLRAISGLWFGKEGAFHPVPEVALSILELGPGARLDLDVARERSLFFYVIRGELAVNETRVPRTTLVDFHDDGSQLAMESDSGSLVLLGHAQPLGEPVVMGGPFVMNTEAEVRQAFLDFGLLEEP